MRKLFAIISALITGAISLTAITSGQSATAGAWN
jgi:hypothetical protein